MDQCRRARALILRAPPKFFDADGKSDQEGIALATNIDQSISDGDDFVVSGAVTDALSARGLMVFRRLHRLKWMGAAYFAAIAACALAF
ncbi:hypothetical protein IGB42_02974 [Andreprevotia sp. IGB-42]|uniref:hypothetical protein n=1 Tax=Andreprevotia sp. IGB-42 TaxID=2497473 RepID=UPI0013582B02|nr:hypothetical protein [Andreprevotia sp. IGB-42]KAF0812682.1 hypothetical protein IGB42_02974 [Andreprevotia sp. IGB-42]